MMPSRRAAAGRRSISILRWAGREVACILFVSCVFLFLLFSVKMLKKKKAEVCFCSARYKRVAAFCNERQVWLCGCARESVQCAADRQISSRDMKRARTTCYCVCVRVLVVCVGVGREILLFCSLSELTRPLRGTRLHSQHNVWAALTFLSQSGTLPTIPA